MSVCVPGYRVSSKCFDYETSEVINFPCMQVCPDTGSSGSYDWIGCCFLAIFLLLIVSGGITYLYRKYRAQIRSVLGFFFCGMACLLSPQQNNGHGSQRAPSVSQLEAGQSLAIENA